MVRCSRALRRTIGLVTGVQQQFDGRGPVWGRFATQTRSHQGLMLPLSRCPDGETGRRKRLKISRARARAGSNPAPGTTYHHHHRRRVPMAHASRSPVLVVTDLQLVVNKPLSGAVFFRHRRDGRTLRAFVKRTHGDVNSEPLWQIQCSGIAAMLRPPGFSARLDPGPGPQLSRGALAGPIDTRAANRHPGSLHR